MPLALPAASARNERSFYSGVVLLIAATILIGFARTYYLRPFVGTTVGSGERQLTPLIHVHAVLFTGWIALLLVQVRLIAARRVALHRRLGLTGGVLALAMVVVGTLTAFQGVARGVSVGGIEPRRFLALPFFAIVVFALLFAAGLALRGNAQAHKRLMLLATIALLPPALARFLIGQMGIGTPALIFGVVVFYVVLIVVWDLVTRRRLHAATLWGGAIVVLSGPLRLAIAGTDAWLAFADWAVRLGT